MNNTIPGLILPTQRGMLAGNPRDSAIAEGNAANLKLQALQSIGGSRKYKLKRGGASATQNSIPIAQFNMQYTPQGGDTQVPNSIIRQSAIIATQNAANSVYDNFAMQKGGRFNNNTNNYQWGCYSGGKNKTIRKSQKKKRSARRRSRRNKTRKHKKSNK
jgi:hypothetical protein